VDKTGSAVGYVAVKRDITRETDLEQQFHAAQRMESIGQLVSGIDHDFNNLLAAMLGNVELLEEAIGTNETARARLTVVRQAVNRATSLTRQLLAFSRRQALQPQVINLNEVVTETVNMLGRVLGDNIRVVTHLASRLARIDADAGQLQQTILNLAVNARDAMPKGGTVTIETSNVELSDQYRGRHGVIQPGEYVLLSVSDSGTGMSPELQDRTFEPFYTTKPKGPMDRARFGDGIRHHQAEWRLHLGVQRSGARKHFQDLPSYNKAIGATKRIDSAFELRREIH
jgi:two-component system, cell cycle sensor histidine kinase and response regulator CckA